MLVINHPSISCQQLHLTNLCPKLILSPRTFSSVENTGLLYKKPLTTKSLKRSIPKLDKTQKSKKRQRNRILVSAPIKVEVNEFQINSHTSSDQTNPSTALLSNGNVVVTWQGFNSNTHDSNTKNISARIFKPDTTMISREFQVNTYFFNNQIKPKVAAFPSGGFAIVWSSYNEDLSAEGVYLQIFNNSGGKILSEQPVNTYTINDQTNPDIAILTSEKFVVTWDSKLQEDLNSVGIYAQLYEKTGERIGTEIHVNTNNTIGNQSNPVIAALDNGGFVIAYTSLDSQGSGIKIQIMDANGSHLGNYIAVNDFEVKDQKNPAICTIIDGRFVIVWESVDQDGSDTGIYAKIFFEDGSAVQPEFGVNSLTTGAQVYPKVARLTKGGFWVAWYTFNQYMGNKYAPHYKMYNQDGTQIGTDEIAISSKLSYVSLGLDITSVNQGQLFTTYTLDDNADGDGAGVFGQFWQTYAPTDITLANPKTIRILKDSLQIGELTTLTYGNSVTLLTSFLYFHSQLFINY